MSPLNHPRDLQGKSPAARQARIKGEGRSGTAAPAALSHQVRIHRDLVTLPPEGTPHPSPPTPLLAQGCREGCCRNSSRAEKEPPPRPAPPAPAHPAPALPPHSRSQLLRHRARGGRAPDPDADAAQGTGAGVAARTPGASG